METKKEILTRTYIVFLVLVGVCLFVLVKVAYIQLAQGKYWRSMADSAHIRFESIAAERGTIYSESGEVLSTSVPEFDIYIDFQADGLIEKEGQLYHQYADSLSIGLAKLFKDRTVKEYKKLLDKGFRSKDRFVLLKRKISFADYEDLKQLPLVKLGKNKSGFIAVVRMKRLYPYKLLANRTIGIARENNKVGLEKKYDQFLGGTDGKRLVRYIAGGAGVPIEGTDQEPQDGSDVVTTLDVNIQEIAQQALQKMMVENEALRGTCIVMEVKTGKVKAIANLGRQSDGNYWEDYNYALSASEPGSTWKLVTLMAVLQDKKVTLNSIVDLEGGRWPVAGQVVFDSEVHGMHAATIQQSFEKSSNVGMAKLTYYHYGNKPSEFLQHLHNWRMDSITGIDLPGESRPNIYKPGSRHWSNTTLPWMGFGYNLTITPMHTAMLYNAVANGGKMMKPYVVNALLKDGKVVQQYEPVVLNAQIADREVIAQVRQSLEGVVLNGTGRGMKTDAYTFAGKTGTSLVADKGITYADKMYQSSFAGYFPANDPKYTIVVVIRNKAHAAKFYGASVAGPVFREVADRIYATHLFKQPQVQPGKADSTSFQLYARQQTLKKLAGFFGWRMSDSSANSMVALFENSAGKGKILRSADKQDAAMPPLQGVGLKDALAVCEEKGLMVTVAGRGKVVAQSILPGTPISKGQTIHLQLN
ncbi:penicillin-binding protein [Phnomibacter sp. MR]|uniref:penicillin-binding protein n=1 Tax=Phnomibacter sp. MR TaxID=3042318 RepID=UPI003A7FF2F1